MGVASIFGQKPFELLARLSQIAGRGVSLGQTERSLARLVGFAAFAFEPLEQAVELIVLEVKLRDSLDDA